MMDLAMMGSGTGEIIEERMSSACLQSVELKVDKVVGIGGFDENLLSTPMWFSYLKCDQDRRSW